MLLWISAALASSIFLNGVEVPTTALAGLDLDQVDVHVDAAGDVYVRAPGYAWARDRLVVAEQRRGTAEPEWVVLAEDTTSSGMEMTIFAGDYRVKRLSSGGGAVVVPVDALLHRGSNTFRIDVATQGRASGRMAVTVAQAVRQDGLFVLQGEPTRYLVNARAGSIEFQVER